MEEVEVRGDDPTTDVIEETFFKDVPREYVKEYMRSPKYLETPIAQQAKEIQILSSLETLGAKERKAQLYKSGEGAISSGFTAQQDNIKAAINSANVAAQGKDEGFLLALGGNPADLTLTATEASDYNNIISRKRDISQYFVNGINWTSDGNALIEGSALAQRVPEVQVYLDAVEQGGGHLAAPNLAKGIDTYLRSGAGPNDSRTGWSIDRLKALDIDFYSGHGNGYSVKNGQFQWDDEKSGARANVLYQLINQVKRFDLGIYDKQDDDINRHINVGKEIDFDLGNF